jgi:hypothetical protein
MVGGLLVGDIEHVDLSVAVKLGAHSLGQRDRGGAVGAAGKDQYLHQRPLEGCRPRGWARGGHHSSGLPGCGSRRRCCRRGRPAAPGPGPGWQRPGRRPGGSRRPDGRGGSQQSRTSAGRPGGWRPWAEAGRAGESAAGRQLLIGLQQPEGCAGRVAKGPEVLGDQVGAGRGRRSGRPRPNSGIGDGGPSSNRGDDLGAAGFGRPRGGGQPGSPGCCRINTVARISSREPTLISA